MIIQRIIVSVNTKFLGEVIFVTSFLWHLFCDVQIHDITWFTQNHEKCYQILDSYKRSDRPHRCPAGTLIILQKGFKPFLQLQKWRLSLFQSIISLEFRIRQSRCLNLQTSHFKYLSWLVYFTLVSIKLLIHSTSDTPFLKASDKEGHVSLKNK